MEDVKDPVVSTTGEGGTVITPETQVKPGEKTDPNLLLESLQNERDKRREKEDRIKELEQELTLAKRTTEPTEAFSDEGKLLQKQIVSLKDELALKDVSAQYPALKDKSKEFEEFRKDYPGVSLEKSAKLFLAENDLLETPKTRIGLEKPSGGGRTQPTGTTLKEFDEIRVTNPRKYREMLKAGKSPRE